jgi:hypothetical protein
LLGLGKFRHVIFSHVISSVTNVLLFMLINNSLPATWIALPCALSTIVSSLYLIRHFKMDFQFSRSLVQGDIFLNFYGYFIITISCFISASHGHEMILITILTIHVPFLLFILRKNDFIIILVNAFFKQIPDSLKFFFRRI